MSQKIGFIGTGIMGHPMSMNILNKGYELMVWNRTARKTDVFHTTGADVAATPRDVGSWADIIILMLTGPEAIDAVLEGEQGLLEAKVSGKTLINMSTVPPDYTLRLDQTLRSHDISLIEAPVGGTRKPAEEGTLIILAGGPEEKIAELEPLLLTMGQKVIRCGEIGQGSAMKVAFNLLLGTLMAGLSEALNLGQGCGLSSDAILSVINASPLGCALFSLKADMVKADAYPAQFPLRHMAKDMDFALRTAHEKGVATPVGQALFQLYRHGVWQGMGDMDFAAVRKVLEAMNDNRSADDEAGK